MSTQKQIKANQLNALKSTGPKTEAGKAAVRQNALKHGLHAMDVVIPGENEEDFSALTEDLFAHWQPVGPMEEDLVERLGVLIWQQRRSVRVEAGIFACEIEKPSYRSPSCRQRSAAAFISRESAFASVLRYRMQVERSYFRTLHELQRLQATRAGQFVPLPAAVEIDVHVAHCAEQPQLEEVPRPEESSTASNDKTEATDVPKAA